MLWQEAGAEQCGADSFPPRSQQFRTLSAALFGIALLACCALLGELWRTNAFDQQGWYNAWDAALLRLVNRHADHWPSFDTAAVFFAQENLLKGAPIVCLYWIAFFHPLPSRSEQLRRRATLVTALPLAVLSVLLARALAASMPFRERPLRTFALHFQVPHTASASALYGWSSFPSDHATLFVGMSLGLLFASSLWGWLAIVYTIFCIIGPRLYLGIHWPSDLAAGALLGAVMVLPAAFSRFQAWSWQIAHRSWSRFPGLTAVSAFLISYELTNLFDGPIRIASALLKHH